MAVAAPKELGLQDYVALVNRYIDKGMTDGLPVIPPSNDAVLAMCAAAGLPPDQVVGEFPIRTAPVTMKDIATNALMAGCLPEYMPVVRTAYEIMFQPGFGTSHMTQSAGSFLPWFMLNGPIRHRLGVNSRAGAFGPGSRANAAIGRAIRLGVINLAYSTPKVADRGSVGSPYRLTMVNGEDEERSPWDPLHVSMGFKPEDSTLIVMKSSQPHNMSFEARSAEELLDAIADRWNRIGNFSDGINIHPEEEQYQGTSGFGQRRMLLMAEGHRALLAGWSREKIQRYLVDKGLGRTAGEIRAVQFIGWGRLKPTDPDSTFLSSLRIKPEQIIVMSVGGPGMHTLIGNASSIDIRKVPEVREALPATVAQPPSPRKRSPIDPYVAVIDEAIASGVSDGLPIMPPDRKGLEAMIDGSGRKTADVLGRLETTVDGVAVASRELTVGEVAANALVAGCLPEYMPVIVAALEIILDPEHEMGASFASSDSNSPLVILNGPIRRRLDINCGRNLTGPIHRSNSTIGRAINLALRNIGGLRLARGLGSASYYTGGVFGENEEEEHPWPPLSADYGIAPGASSMVVLDAEHPHTLSNPEASRPDTNFLSFADDISFVEDWAKRRPHPMGVAFILGPDARIHIREHGWARRQVQEYVHQKAGRRAGDIRSLGFGDYIDASLPDDAFLPLFRRAEDVIPIMAGGGSIGNLGARARFLGARTLPE